jgi:chromosome segregation ATPase
LNLREAEVTKFYTANNDLPTLEANYWTLQKAVFSLEAEKHRSTIMIQELNDQIWGLQNIRDSLQSDCREIGLEITKLRIQKIRLEETMNRIQNDGVIHSKIKEIVKRQVEGFLSDPQLIFKLTYQSTSLRKKIPSCFPIRVISFHAIQHNSQIDFPKKLAMRDGIDFDVDQ